VPGYAWKPYLQERAAQVIPIFERSGIESWTEFCVRFAHSFPQVRATVGATSKLENLREFLGATENIESLPEDIVNEITQLHYRWSDEYDMKTEIWTI
jgi:predicted aldo/keto reductase-like oxidoreductase